MARYVIDAPTLLHLVAGGLEVHPDHQLVAPGMIRSQALSLLFADVQDGTLAERVALEQHEKLTAMKIRALNDRVSRRAAWTIAREQGWATTVDAEYIAVCRLQADALVTVDERLASLASGLVETALIAALFAP